VRQRPLDAGMPVILPILLLGLGAGAADDSRAAEEHEDIPWIAPVRLGAGADVGDDTARDLLVRPVHENAFGVRRGEFSPTGPVLSLPPRRCWDRAAAGRSGLPRGTDQPPRAYLRREILAPSRRRALVFCPPAQAVADPGTTTGSQGLARYVGPGRLAAQDAVPEAAGLDSAVGVAARRNSAVATAAPSSDTPGAILA
jgi:hypothetical protein